MTKIIVQWPRPSENTAEADNWREFSRWTHSNKMTAQTEHIIGTVQTIVHLDSDSWVTYIKMMFPHLRITVVK